MSNFTFHPRLTDENLGTLSYYNDSSVTGNPYSSMDPDLHYADVYCYGRFWEVEDEMDPTTPIGTPYNLGYVEYFRRDTPTVARYFHYPRLYWWNADLECFFPATTYFDVRNMDNYNRMQPMYATIDQRILGSCLLFTENDLTEATSLQDIGKVRMIMGEKYFSPGHYIGSTKTTQNNFALFEVVNNQMDHTGTTITLRGVVINPIHRTFDNIIQGHPLYWKLPFWMYKRYLDRRRGLLYD